MYISWTSLLLQLVNSCSYFSQLQTSHQMPREDTKNAINDLYLSLWCTPFPTIFMSKYLQRGDCLRERPILLNYGRSCAVTWQGRTRCQMQELICTICISQFYSSEISHRQNFLEQIRSHYSFDKVTVIRLKGQFLWNRPCAVMARRMDELSFARINLPFYIF